MTEQNSAETDIIPALTPEILPATPSLNGLGVQAHAGPIHRTVEEMNDLFLQESIFMGLASASELLLAADETSLALTQALSIIGAAARLEHIALFKMRDKQEGNDAEQFKLKAVWPQKKWSSMAQDLEVYQRYLCTELKKRFIELERGDICVKSASALHDLLHRWSENTIIGSIALCPIHFKQDLWGLTVLGTSQSMLFSEKALQQLAIGVSGVFGGAVSKIEIENKLRYQALHDALTKLPNRTLFIDRLEQILKHSKRERTYQFTVLYLDLDRFKVVNDSLGHAIGDQLLTQVAQRLVSCTRPRDIVARLGGDEFAILLEDIHEEEHILAIIERIHGELTRSFTVQSYEINCGTSIGISHCHHQYCTPKSILHHADMAMYQAKQSPTDYYRFVQDQYQQRGKYKTTLDRDILNVVESQQLHVFYQPVMSLESLQLEGLAADLRWQHPEWGWLDADKFLPLAEENGMGHAICDFFLRSVCDYLQDAHTQHRLSNTFSISLSCSGKHVMQPHLLPMLQDLLTHQNVAAKRIKLAIADPFLIENIDVVIPKLEALGHLGVGLIIDKFGSNCSSLRYLQYLPVHALRLDPSIIQLPENDPDSLDRLKTIVSLSYNLGLSVIAGDIDTQRQLTILRQLRVDYGQGSCFAEPLDAIASLQWLTGHVTSHPPLPQQLTRLGACGPLA